MSAPDPHRRLIGLLLMALAVLSAAVAPACAESGFSSYLTPFPPKERYKLAVFGDSYGAGLATVLAADLAQQNIDVVNKALPWLGLARSDGNEWDKVVDATTPADEFQIAVIVFGADDRVAIRGPKLRLDFGTQAWRDDYARRVDALLKSLHNRKAAIYWLGLPPMRGENASNAAQIINAIFVERVRLSGAKFVDSWDAFVDAAGAYADFGPDLTGNMRQLRLNDGVHLTIAGNQKLASLVEHEIGHDLAVAQREREVPLAGDENEQHNVRDDSLPRSAGDKTLPQGKSNKDVAADDGSIALAGEAGQPGETIAIVRPAIPGAVLASILSTPSGPVADPGHTLPADLLGGFTVLSSIATSADMQSAARRQQPLTQSPFFKLLIRGDGLSSRPGRADDFQWPRPGTATVSAGAAPDTPQAAN
jgi:uncharacterized protein